MRGGKTQTRPPLLHGAAEAASPPEQQPSHAAAVHAAPPVPPLRWRLSAPPWLQWHQPTTPLRCTLGTATEMTTWRSCAPYSRL